jgi:hypothetical protein
MAERVSPASYRLMINGQSFWGIFPLLLDVSILWTFGCSSCLCVGGAQLAELRSQIFADDAN